MRTNVFSNLPLETTLKNAGFKVNGIEKKDRKTVITVERVIWEVPTGSNSVCLENSYIRENGD